VDLARLGAVNLWEYNVLVLPDGSGSRMLRQLGDAARLKRWVQEGGSIIAVGGAVSLLNHKDVALSTVGIVGQPAEEGKEEKKDEKRAATDTTLSAGNTPAPPLVSPTAPGSERPEGVPGIIASATLDRTHWLTYGYRRDRLAVPVGGAFLTPSKKGDNPVSFLGSDVVLAGFIWPGNTERLLGGSVWAVVENVGRGKVILFAENPLYRAFWRGTAGTFTNAVLMGPGR
jgi:hypothetical protein